VCLHLQLLELAPKAAKGRGRAREASWQCLRAGSLEALLQLLHRKAQDPQPCCKAPGHLCEGPHLGEPGRGAACLPAPISSGCVAQQLPVSPPMGRGWPSKLGSVTSSRNHPHSLPQRAPHLAGRQKQMGLHLKAVDFDTVARDSCSLCGGPLQAAQGQQELKLVFRVLLL